MRYGAFSLQAVQRILAARGRPKTPLDALADDHQTYLDRLLDGEPTPPRPTSDYQALLGEEPHDGEPINPRGTTDPNHPPRTGRPRRRRAPSLHDDVTHGAADAGRRGDPGGARRGAVGGGEGIAEPPGVPAPAARRPGRGPGSSGRWSDESATRSSAS